MKIIHKVKEVKEIPLSEITPNQYNPNSMPFKQMVMLGACMLKYGMVFPVLAFWNPELNKYQIIDGYHRWKSLCDMADRKSSLFKAVCKHLEVNPKEVVVNDICSCVVLDVSIEEAIQLTILMNSIKGSHKVQGMSDVVSTLSTTMKDVDVALNLGMEGEEYMRLKNQNKERVTANAFKHHTYSKEWIVNEKEHE